MKKEIKVEDKSVIVLSIKPRYANKILKREKTVELRRIRPKRIGNGTIVLLYASSPVQSLIGAFIVDKVVEAPKNDLWNDVKLKACVTKEEYENYFTDKHLGIGIFISSTYQFENPIILDDIKELWNDFVPPQGFRYASINNLKTPEILNIYEVNAV